MATQHRQFQGHWRALASTGEALAQRAYPRSAIMPRI
ncbi:hypothetical protein A2U01_0098360 [Trifolium medium]|nr:hypothetical protein [Trifolium medium]